ncbi:MAG TPA: pseudouridine synthase [Pseudomonadota bacterium]|nr:pseudouridine synthase [Pseudomonadota bacterium]
MTGIRLQLVLAKGGVASRRAAEAMMQAGRVAVNGRVVSELGTRVDPATDRITVDGREVSREPLAYYLLNKPKGYVTTASDPEGRATVFDLLNEQGITCRVAPPPGQVLDPAKARPQQSAGLRLFAVGRLDYNTEGALLLTNDGELAHALMHPSRGVAKFYHAKLRGEVSREQILRLQRGVELPPARVLDAEGKPVEDEVRRATGRGKPAKQVREHSAPCEVRLIKYTGRHTWLEFELHEGKNRQIHRMSEAIGSSLLKLMRVAYADLELGDLETGAARPLTPREINALRAQVGLAPPPADAVQQPPRERRPLRRDSRDFDARGGAGARPPRRDFGDDRRPSRSGPPRREWGDSARPDSRSFGDDRRPPRSGPPRAEWGAAARPESRPFSDDRRPPRSGPPRREWGDAARPDSRSFGEDRRPPRSGPPRAEWGAAARTESRPFGDDRRPPRSGPPRREGVDAPRSDSRGFGEDRRPPRREWGDAARPDSRSFGEDRRPPRSGPPRAEWGAAARPESRPFNDDRRPPRSGPPRREWSDAPRSDSRSFGEDRRPPRSGPPRSGPPRREGGDAPRPDSRSFGEDRRPQRSGPPRSGWGAGDRADARSFSDDRRPPRPRFGDSPDRRGGDRPRFRPEGDDARH